MKAARETMCIVTLVLVMVTKLGFGFTQFIDGGTHNISTQINDDIWVDYQAPSKQTTVNFLNGAALYIPYKIQSYNDAKVNINGGVIGHDLNSFDSSSVTVSAGSVEHLNAWDNSQTYISGGFVRTFSTSSNGHTAITGGTVDTLYTGYNSRVNIYGGIMIYNGLNLSNSSVVTIYGHDFAVDGQTVGYGPLNSILHGEPLNEPSRRLTGILSNSGSNSGWINCNFLIGGNASIVLVPEPTTLSLFAPGVLALWRRKR